MCVFFSFSGGLSVAVLLYSSVGGFVCDVVLSLFAHLSILVLVTFVTVTFFVCCLI